MNAATPLSPASRLQELFANILAGSGGVRKDGNRLRETIARMAQENPSGEGPEHRILRGLAVALPLASVSAESPALSGSSPAIAPQATAIQQSREFGK